jgi:aflatoxin B1 aldehyde reductase
MPSRVPLSIGTMCFGPNERITDLNDVQKCLDVFKSFGQNQLDTARMYGTGHTEEYLGQLDLSGLIIDTKVYPASPGDHAPEKLRQTFKTSLEKLKVKKVRILYLHAPDRATPFEDTIREMDALHKEGLFEEFGLSNYASWVGKVEDVGCA